MATWFECRVKYDKLMPETGLQKTVTEPYMVEALSFTEAEARITEEMKPYISGEFVVSAVKKVKLDEMFFDETGDKWYKAKINMITIDEKKGVEKKISFYNFVQAAEFKDALNNLLEGMKGTLGDYEIASITETTLLDVFPVDLSQTLADKAAKAEAQSQK